MRGSSEMNNRQAEEKKKEEEKHRINNIAGTLRIVDKNASERQMLSTEEHR